MSLIIHPALASNLSLGPISLALSAQQKVAVLTLTNNADTPDIIELTPKLWLQEGNQDIYKSTSDLIVTPPIVTLQPHSPQVIRIGLAGNQFADKETAYRLYLTEILPRKSDQAKVIRVGLNVGIPVFVKAQADAAPKLTWKAQLVKDKLHLTLYNAGNQHIKLEQIQLYNRDQTKPFAGQMVSAYILAKHSRSLVIPMSKQSNLIKIKALLEQGSVETNLRIPT